MAKKKFGEYPDLDPQPPPDREVFFLNEKGSLCEASLAASYTWIGADAWYKTKKKAPVNAMPK